MYGQGLEGAFKFAPSDDCLKIECANVTPSDRMIGFNTSNARVWVPAIIRRVLPLLMTHVDVG